MTCRTVQGVVDGELDDCGLHEGFSWRSGAKVGGLMILIRFRSRRALDHKSGMQGGGRQSTRTYASTARKKQKNDFQLRLQKGETRIASPLAVGEKYL